MSHAATPAGDRGIRGLPSIAFAIVVLVAAVYSFSHRPPPPFPASQLFPDKVMINGLARSGERIVAVGEQGRILVADKADGPWREAKVEPQRGSTLAQVIFISDNVALAAGHDAWILRSEDKGETWKEVFFVDTPVEKPLPPPTAEGGAEGAPVIAPPPDAVPMGESPPEVAFSGPPDTGSETAGAAPAEAVTPDPVLGLAGPFDGRILAVGGFGQFLVSKDEGRTWEHANHAQMGDHHMNGLTAAGDGSLIAVGERGLLVRSTDAGRSWATMPQIYNGSFFGIVRTPGNVLVAYGMRSNVFTSADNGRSWKKAEVPEGVSLFGGAVDADGAIVLVGDGDTVIRSTDNGAKFTVAATGKRERLAAVLSGSTAGWVVAGEGGVRVMKEGDKAHDEAAAPGGHP